jgi:threonine/homoserine/homoserine lactone efflux protein
MVPFGVLMAFVATTCVFMLIPGPAMLYVATVGVERGRRAGMAAAGGLATGSLVLATGAAVGLTAVLAASEVLFTVVKLCGVAYLVYLGVRRLMTPMPVLDAGREGARSGESGTGRVSAWSVWRREGLRGVLVGLSNPKDALFFVSFLPQFVSREYGSVQIQMLILGVAFAVIAVLFDSVYATLAAQLRRLLLAKPHIWRSQRWTSGIVYLAMAAVSAFSSHQVRRV